MDVTIKTEQKQTLSYKTIQTSTVLQMNAVQLEAYLNEQALENPVLILHSAAPGELHANPSETYDWISSHDEQNRYLYEQLETQDPEPAKWTVPENLPETLADYLWSQLLTAIHPIPHEKALCFLLDSLDEKGYFTDSLETFAHRFDLTPKQADELLRLIQSLEPAGIGARNLEECLCLQLKRLGVLTPDFQDFLHSNLSLLAKNQLAAISRTTKLPLPEVKSYCEQIKKLNPRPGAAFTHMNQICYILPDVIVTTFGRDSDISLNESLYATISLDRYYLQLYHTCKDKEAQNYLQQKIQQAQLLSQCVLQRNATLLSVSKEIYTMQQEFFSLGPDHLKPLKQTEIAANLGIHVSTVSRACNQKYLQCAWGIFPLHAFFVKKAPAATADAATKSAATALDVQNALTALIEQEDKSKPCSDRILAELLTAQGFPVSRRTVAKYRDELSIPGTTGRKTY